MSTWKGLLLGLFLNLAAAAENVQTAKFGNHYKGHVTVYKSFTYQYNGNKSRNVSAMRIHFCGIKAFPHSPVFVTAKTRSDGGQVWRTPMNSTAAATITECYNRTVVNPIETVSTDKLVLEVEISTFNPSFTKFQLFVTAIY